MFFNVMKMLTELGVEITKGAEIFQIHSVGFHVKGGNIV